jgi:pimeloyl-ACP methyl ester carboxylesterase
LSARSAELSGLTGELMKVPAKVSRAMFAGLLVYDALAEIEYITAPTLLVWGDADGLVESRHANDARRTHL